jgi:hypothetical protein
VSTASHARTIARELAHRYAVAEVFVTSLDTVAQDVFVAGAQLPRMHAYYGDHAGSLAMRHDPLLVMEAARQAAIALTHEFYGVPTDMAFVVRTFNGTASDTSAWEVGTAPSDLVMRVRVPQRHTRGGVLHGLDMVLDIECADVPMLTVDGSFSWVTSRQWSGLRSAFRDSLGLGPFRGASALTERATPAAVGRENWRNVVIGPPVLGGATTRARVVADLGHPFLFDHQLDHVPGSLLIEACRQTALSMVVHELPQLECVASTFDRFIELDLPAECVAEIVEQGAGSMVIHCEIHQAGAVAAEIDFEFAEDTLDPESDPDIGGV